MFLFFYLLYQAKDILRTAWITPPCDLYSVIIKKENVAVVRKAVHFNDNELTKNDPFFKERNFKILDLRTETEDQASHFNFKVLCKVMDGDETVLAEIDSDSHITIICESYFEKHLKETVEKENRFLEESPPRFKGINGPWIVSKYPPVKLDIQIGSVLLSGRFVVTPELSTSSVLLGSDIIMKYGISLVSSKDGQWRCRVGYNPSSISVCVVTKKLEAENKCLKMTIDVFESDVDSQLGTGYVVRSGVLDKSAELSAITDNKKIPDNYKKQLIDCLTSIPELYSGTAEFSKEPVPAHIYTHDVEFLTETEPVLNLHPYKLTGIRLQQQEDVIQTMCEQGILAPGDSSTVSPVFFVGKKANEGHTAELGRLVYDYRALNALVKGQNHPLANIDNFFEAASQYTIFSIIDIRNAFLSVGLTERAKKRCAIITPSGVYLPQRLPFGLKTSPSAFCFVMSKCLGGIEGASFYMDDVILGARNNEEMTNLLIKVFKRLNSFNLKIQLSKVKFFESEVKILGLIFSKNGKQIDPKKITTISNFPEITTLKACQKFLGTVNYLSSFIPHFASRMYPVYALLRKENQKDFKMSQEALDAISDIKEFLKKETMIYNIDTKEPVYLSVDASQVGVGAFLYQICSYPNSEDGKKKMLNDLGYIPENKMEVHLIPGVSPGRNTPVVRSFLNKNDEKGHTIFYEAYFRNNFK
jgi:hypothetical protein